ncbi:MAG: flagellar biosynthesis protein FlhB [Thalassovita sp.]
MAEGGDGQEKTEEPTQKKKDDSRKEGKVITSKEMFVFASMVGAIVILMAGGAYGPSLTNSWAAFFRFDAAENLDIQIIDKLRDATNQVLWIGMAIGAPLLILTIAMQGAMGGLIFAPKAFKPKMSKFNLIKGIGRMVSTKALVELSKAVLKVILLSVAAGIILWDWLPTLSSTAFMAPGDMMTTLSDAAYRVLASLVIALAIIGAVDLMYQIYTQNKSLKMSKQEIKDEMKQSQGSPELKGAIRRRQQEAARDGATRRAALEEVSYATAVLTNPKHFSVALRYVPGEDDAPSIIALGEGAMAFQIRERANDHDIRIIEVPPLARALYFTSKIGGEIHPGLYAAVATILAHVYHLDQDDSVETPEIEVPEDFRFDENGMIAA